MVEYGPSAPRTNSEARSRHALGAFTKAKKSNLAIGIRCLWPLLGVIGPAALGGQQSYYILSAIPYLYIYTYLLPIFMQPIFGPSDLISFLIFNQFKNSFF